MGRNGQTRCKTCYDASRPEEVGSSCGEMCAPCARTEAGPVCTRCHGAASAEPCTDCGRLRPVAARPADGPVCGSCWRRCSAAECSSCGRTLPVRSRTSDGPVCAACFARAAPPGRCSGCGRHGPIKLKKRNPCSTCAGKRRPPEPCPDCGRTRPVAIRDARSPQYHACWRRQHRALCTWRSQDRPALGTLDGRPYCPYCWEKVRPSAALCADCGRLPAALASRQDGLRRCRRCHQVMPAPCARCGTVTKAERYWPEDPVCLTCGHHPLRSRRCASIQLASPAPCAAAWASSTAAAAARPAAPPNASTRCSPQARTICGPNSRPCASTRPAIPARTPSSPTSTAPTDG